LAEFRQQAGMIFQNPDDQIFMPSVYEDIAFGPRNFGYTEKELESRMDEALESLAITHLKNRPTYKLSGGEKRLVALAGVLVMSPKLLLMDEPSSFLDPRARKRLIELLASLPQTMLIATHDLDMALELCERVLLLRKGQLYADGPAGKILRDVSLLDACDLEPPLSIKQ
jgi:cobalt/nickel transport system ATP-binding protein